ncbi:MAG TPA: response regulator [Bacteriovoracaceae bacterium]|nr:response regulator [Bacteriovoracaceae bacterium]
MVNEIPAHSVMVVEDDDDIRNVMVDLLESEGYRTQAATNGLEALKILNNTPKPSLVLLDMMMPIMNGRQFLDVVSADTHLARIPVVIVSAIADKTNTEGSVAFLKKPIDIDNFLKVVAQYCCT